MGRATQAAWAAVVWGMLTGGVAAGPAPARRVYLSDSAARGAVERAILGAQSRLGRPDCRLILTDFADQAGHPLLANLEATGLQPAVYAVERIWFVDGTETPQCLKAQEMVAFTEAGSKVVHVCAARFTKAAQEGAAAEVLIIHELLHTLGLGENPPSSRDITRRVTFRCGGS
jgi:hypothetical protein